MSHVPEEDTRLNRLMQWRQGETPGPWQMVVFPTNRCNLKCTMCWQRWVEEKWGTLDHSRELSDERLMRLVDEAADMNVREWTIGGGGDPMVRGDLVMQMCARIRERGMNGGLFTNGTLFRRDHLEHLVRIGWEHVDISLDGPTAEINDAIRSEGSFERAVAAMRELVEIRESHGATNPVIDVHIVVTRLNFDHLHNMVRMVGALGAKRFGLSFLHVQSDQCVTLQLLDHQWQQLPDVSRSVHALGMKLGMESSAWTIAEAMQCRQKRDKSCGDNQEDPFLSSGCYEPFLNAAMVSEGYVGPCCAFWDEAADNLRDKSLREIWTGEYLQNIRQRLLMRDFPAFCEFCPSHFVWQTGEIRKKLFHIVGQRIPSEPGEPIPVRPLGIGLAQQCLRSLRERGVPATLQRGKEWLTLALRSGTHR